MMARQHILLGAAGWMGAVIPLTHRAGLDMTATQAVTGTLVASGAALLPDIDHPDSTVAHTLGPLTRSLAWATARVTGGHRHATHSILFAVGAGIIAALAVDHLGRAAMFAVLWFCGSWALRLMAPHSFHGAIAPLVAGVVAWWASGIVPGGLWTGVAVGAGCLLHLAGDLVTKGPIPLSWPFPGRFSFDLIRTGGLAEHAVSWVLVVAVVVLGYRLMTA